jgi:hypothetical protein
MSGPGTVLVNSSSASQGRPWETDIRYRQSINRTHSDLVKFSRQDHDYIVVLEYLRESSRSAERVIRFRFPELMSSPEPEAANSTDSNYESQRLSGRYIHRMRLVELLRRLFNHSWSVEVSKPLLSLFS